MEIVGHITRAEQCRGRMVGIKIKQCAGRGTQPRGKTVLSLNRLLQVGDLQHGAADLLGLQLRKDLLGGGDIGHADSLDGGAQQGLDCFRVGGLHLESTGDGSGLAFTQQRREASLKNGFRTFAETLELFRELLEQIQAGGALCELPVDVLKLFLSVAEFAGEIADQNLHVLRFLMGAGLGDVGLLDARGQLCGELRGRRLLLADQLKFAGDGLVAMRGGFLIDLVAGTIGAETGDVALELKELELRLLDLLLMLGQLGLDDGELAVAILEDGVGAAEERQLELLVLRAGVHLGRQLVELHFEFAEVGTRRF